MFFYLWIEIMLKEVLLDIDLSAEILQWIIGKSQSINMPKENKILKTII